MTNQEMVDNVLHGYEESCHGANKPNILVIGPSGAGKSTLINELFGEEICKVGSGKPCTDNFVYYDSNPYINIYDSKGLERDTNIDKFINDVFKFIDTKNGSIDAEKHTRIALYCIGEPRLQESDIKLINAISSKRVMPILVFTKSDTRSEEEIAALKKAAGEYKLIMEDVIFTASKKANEKLYEIAPDEIKNGIRQLLERILYYTPETDKISIMAAQEINTEMKIKAIKKLKDKAKDIVIKYAALAAGGGAIPIPGPDALVITELQFKMIGELGAVYNIHVGKEKLAPLLAAFAGVMTARQLMKLLPIAGWIISAAIAGTITGGLGYFCIDRFEKKAVSAAKGEPQEEFDFDISFDVSYTPLTLPTTPYV